MKYNPETYELEGNVEIPNLKHISHWLPDFGNYANNPSARSIIRSKIASTEKPLNKYNVGLIRMVEEDTGNVAADYRDGSDTGSEMENLIEHNNQF